MLMVIDSIALALGVVAANRIWLGSDWSLYNLGIAGALVPLYLIAGINNAAFSADALPSMRLGAYRAFRAILLAASGVVLTAFFLKAGEHISRVTVLLGSAMSMMLLIAARSAFHYWTRRRFGTALHSNVVIRDGCSFDAPPGAFVVDAAEIDIRCDLRDPLMLDRIGKLLKPADRVLVACSEERRRDWAMVLKGANIRGEVLSAELGVLGPIGIGSFGDSATVIVSAGSLDLRQRIVKRALDLALGVTALIVLAPFLLIVALAVKLDSPGAVLFVQDRVGRGNRLFGMYKFRSMRSDACDSKASKLTTRGDARVTKVGRFIRATSIDELPQIFNIIKGDMSFVGPRPHALGALAGDLLYWEVDERYWHRHSCKPGLTGLAQVRGFRGNTYREIDLTNRLQADLQYVSGWSIWRDVSILLATLRVVVHRNAY
jgi:lipopolysaccharide/colanic/teichoic acid biosynthesis glycosyltransferase